MKQVFYNLPIPDWVPIIGGDRPIYGYGVMLVVGFLVATQAAKWLARRTVPRTDKGDPGELFVNAAILGLVAGIIGARVSHVLENFAQFNDPNKAAWENIRNMLNIGSGGLTYYGGFLLAFPVLVFYAIRKKIPVRLGMDIIAPCLMIGLGFGRVGCFLNGCCEGARCELPWAVQFPYASLPYQMEVDQGFISVPDKLIDGYDRIPGGRPVLRSPRKIDIALSERPNDKTLLSIRAEMNGQHSLKLHPAQLYSAFTAFLLGGLLLAFFTIPHAAGRVFALMLILEGASRFVLEMLRVEPAVIAPFSLSMIIGMGLVLLGVGLWILFGGKSGETAILSHR